MMVKVEKTGLGKVIGRNPNNISVFYNRTGKRDKDGRMLFEVLSVLDFTSKK